MTIIFFRIVISVILLASNKWFKLIVAKQNETVLSKLESKVVQGVPAAIENFPFAAIFFNDNHMCSGVILNSYGVLTAAHCLNYNKDKRKMFIEINMSHLQDDDAEVFDVLTFIIHEKFNHLISFNADVAIIFVTESIKFGKRKQRALLSNSNDWMKKRINITVIGWGYTNFGGPISNLLLKTNLQFVDKRKCEKLHGVRLPEDMFCLYGNGSRDTCKGDSGGGVVWNKTVLGLVSHGDGCAKKDKPSIYLNVYFHRRWIKNKLLKFHKNYCMLKKRFEK